MADEPTGNLDSQTGVEIMALFDNLHQQGNTIVLVTHEHDIAEYAHRVIHIRDGQVFSDQKTARASKIFQNQHSRPAQRRAFGFWRRTGCTLKASIYLFLRPMPVLSFVACSIIAFLINASFLLAQFPVGINHSDDSLPAQMRELVSKYCRTEYEGARLDTSSWSKIQPLVWWRSSPEYSQIDVISRYEVDSEPRVESWQVHGWRALSLVGNLRYGQRLCARACRYNAGRIVHGHQPENTEWRIADAENTYPHPSRAAMLKWLNDKIAGAQTLRRKLAIRKH